MLRIIQSLVINDLAYAFKNKTFFLVLFIPLFVFVSMSLVDEADTAAAPFKIGILEDADYAPAIVAGINFANLSFAVTKLNNEATGVELLKAGELEGVLVENANVPGKPALLVLQNNSPRTIAMMQTFSSLQLTVEGNTPDWISETRALSSNHNQNAAMPTWILMLVLLIGFIILPMQVAEEKEKKLLLGLLQTPMLEIQWLIAKLILGMILIITAVGFLHLLGNFHPQQLLVYFAFILAGSFCFSAYGIFLGFLCRTQATARTLGLVFFLPHLLPSALSDVSQKLTTIAPFIPSYQLFKPLQTLFLEQGTTTEMSLAWLFLFVLGLVLFGFSYLLMKKRWLM